ncbi:hypoxanthine phosphoribosyltransferase [Peptococcaceae bacterium SCADC1_2_3]|nr:hypoxanthine phosphoribosyltransferase [Peptococcaceae bacterium SCADC1_2_3]KFI34741.1 hypoxanthine phosphoribosyltransferase [Peptococcaceae bacterium SCADC1_2_3]KFI34914.1 hypoxanthine phosphoribosyltransferase [Peptococcaceae bacterium SCADC1_2_3]KFI38080.1 hypoxanthine phosphoribosyltransferase [Peptococcaceae bacterium SCADC1_2_3]
MSRKKIFLTEEKIKHRIEQLGKEISLAYLDQEVMVVGVLKGAFIFMADLVRSLTIPVKVDFVAVSSYGFSSQSSGVVQIIKDTGQSITNKQVLIIEDIVDTGLTLHYLKERFLAREPKEVKICTLLDKPARREVPLKADYVGFVVPDAFLVGYGLDYQEKYRNLRDIFIIEV